MRGIFEPRTRRGFCNIASPAAPACGVRRGVALLTAAALLSLAGRVGAAAPAPPPAPSGQVTAAAGLTLDGSPAVSGQTFFPGSDVTTAERTRAALALDNLARLELSGGTALRLDFSASTVGGSLEAGGARVYAPPGVAASLKTADASVASGTEGGPALFSVEVSEDGTTLSVQTGRVEMRAGGRALTAAAGQTLRAAHGSAPAPAPPQGQNLSGRKRTGLFVGIAAALAAVIIVIAGNDDEEDDFITPCPLIISPNGSIPPC